MFYFLVSVPKTCDHSLVTMDVLLPNSMIWFIY